MPAGFKIAEAYVAVVPKDQGFEASLRELVDMASENVKAEISAGLTKDAPEELRADLDAALHLVTDGLTADVGMGLKNDAVEELDADVKAGVELVQDNNKVKVKVDPQAAKDSFAGLSPLLLGAFGAAATAGPGVVLAAVATAVVAAGALVQKNNVQVTNEAVKLAGDATDAIKRATTPLVPALVQSLQILDQGVEKTKPELRDLFSAAVPFATELTSGVTQLVENALPGLVTGLRAAAPYSSELASDFGKLGTGVSEFVSGLATGAQGGAIGLDALITVVEHLLGDIGQIIGSLSNGLGPALHDVSDVAIPVADDLTKVIKAFPPGDVRVAADAAVALFTAFKIASMAGIIAEGTTFVAFLKAAAAGEIELTGETGVLTVAMDGLATAADAAAGPLGLVAIGLAANAHGAGSTSLAYAGVKDAGLELGKTVDDLTKSLEQAASGNKDAQGQLDHTAQLMNQLKDSGAVAAGAFGQLDDALTNVYRSNPQEATKEFNDLTKQLGLSAADATAKLPKYAQAAGLTSLANHDAAAAAQQFADMNTTAAAEVQNLTQSIIVEQEKLAQHAGALGTNTLAALSFIDAQATQNAQLADAIGDYDLASGAANAFKQAQDALYGKYASYSQAQATFTEDLANATQQLTKGKNAIDLHTDAGAKNFTVLNQLASANEQVAESLIKQGGSAAQATASLQKGAQQIDDLAKKSGFTDKQIQQLNIDLYGVPKVKDIRFDANTGPAEQALHHLLNDIDSASGTIQINASVHGLPGGKALGANADGGPVQAGDYSVVGERGIEIVQFGRGGTVIPNEAIRKVSGDTSLAKSGGMGGVTIQNLTIPITGIVDLTDPNSMSTAARRMVANLQNALDQLERSNTGARYR